MPTAFAARMLCALRGYAPLIAQQSTRISSVLSCALLTLFLWSDVVECRAEESKTWLTGRALEKQLGASVGVSWTGVPLRTAITKLGATHRVALMLDRRVDPEQRLTLAVSNESLRECFERIAAQTNLGVTLVGPVVYFGPPESARQLRTLLALRRAEVELLPLARREPFLERRRLTWPELATPRELLTGLAEDASVTIETLQTVPHDLWPAGDWPALTWIDRLSLLLVGFDLTFELRAEGQAVALMPITEPVAIARVYRFRKQQHDAIEKIAKRYAATFTATDQEQTLVGPIELHEAISKELTPRRSRPTKKNAARNEIKTFTLSVKNQPVGKLLTKLSGQMGIQLQFDEQAIQEQGKSLDTPVSVDVKNARLEQLLTAILEPAGLRSYLKAGVTIVTAEE